MNPIELSLEQEFKLRVLENHIRNLNPEQTKQLLLIAVKQLMVKENMIKQFHSLP